MVAYGFAAVLVVGSLILAVFLPPPFTLYDKIAMVALGCAIAGVLHLLGRSRVIADDGGVTLVNVLRVHHYEWAEVLGVSLVEGEPWAKIDLTDGSTISALGIQGSEKALARRQVAELAALIHRYGEAADPRGGEA
jgi:hypothetical protein